MKNFVDFSENLDDKRKQLVQKQKVMQQMERERASRSNQEFQQDKEEKQSRIDQEKEEEKKLEQLKKEIKREIQQELEDEDKKTHKINLVGFSARVFLHEYDHMEGIVFTQRNLNT